MREWHPAVLEDLRRVSSAIVLYRRDLDFFERHVGRDRVRFVPHGVDTAFFRPAPESLEGPRRLLFVGDNGRNLSMLHRVVLRLAGAHPTLRFDLLVPPLRAKPRVRLRLAGLWRHPQVTWHAGLDDEALRALYQSSCLLLLPLTHAGACNAIVEALACGCPIVTTDVGGVPDYGGGTVYPVVSNEDDNAMVELVDRYLADPEWRRQVGASCRRFAEGTLCWSKVREAHRKAYIELSESAL
jgi:glycosyltransferase involved in cell wall biosynthesis